ncbi:MAG TPA: F0F1 ATP synthase subunit gamma [Steroidobacteraceae bacterium]|nr:F0F1 ATP synthase subunit gamma [Steroidobacteraceae bacterium]
MSGLHDIERHIGSMEELRNVVGAMRALAAMRLQEAEQALAGIRRYAAAMAAAVQSAGQLPSAGALVEGPARASAAGRRGLILCTSEHGFVGGFNERLLAAATAELRPGDELYVLGSRGVLLGLEHGRALAWTHPMATRLASVPEIVNRLSEKLFAAIGSGRITQVDALFAGSHPAGQIRRRQLLPLETGPLAPSRGVAAPLHNLPAQALIEGLAAEYVFARLTESAVESLAGENAARFAAMDAARDNVSRQLTSLRASAHQLRQAEITEELLDLVTGEQALRRT